MRLCCGLMDGLMWDAALQPASEAGSDSKPVIILSNNELLSPADAEWGEFTIVEATKEERATLKGAGYAMADWDPLQGLGCSGCKTGATGDDEPPGEAEREA